MKKVLLLAAAVSALAGCAAQEGNTGPVVEKQYRTGSNLAVRHAQPGDPVTTVSKEDLDRARDSSMNPGAGIPPPRPGGR
jgi:type IV pilus biogenesis protein CpaD/CtpE